MEGFFHQASDRNEMECSGRRWSHGPTLSRLSGWGQILCLAGLRPVPPPVVAVMWGGVPFSRFYQKHTWW